MSALLGRNQRQLQERRCGRLWFPLLAKDARNGAPHLFGGHAVKRPAPSASPSAPLGASAKQGRLCPSKKRRDEDEASGPGIAMALGCGRVHAINQNLVRRGLLLRSGSLRGRNIDPQFQFDEVVGCFAVSWSVGNDCMHSLDVVTVAEMILPVP